jgi:dephospho-CoA kinase
MGLIGGIGSGKSMLARELARHGAKVIVADELGHQALREPAIQQQLIQRWGKEICDETGALSRRKIAALVFTNSAELKALESVVFPYIERGIDEQITQARQQGAVRFVVLDAAILLETGWGQRCDWIVFVHTPRGQRLERLAQQRGWDEKEVRRRSQAQLPLAEKVTRAHFVVDNSGSPHELALQVDRLLAGPELSACLASQPMI